MSSSDPPGWRYFSATVVRTANEQEDDVKLSFHGADRTVTGSCHLVECAGKQVLIDCGMRQGSRALSEESAAPFGFDAAGIDYVLLTHADLDHCGRLPLLAKRGFRGEIITTSASRELARLVMLDAAHLQEEDARYHARKAGHGGASRATNGPLYSILDALNSLDFFGRTANYGQPLDVAAGLRATFIDAGHILGSASIFLEFVEQGRRTSVLFSGDLGNSGRPLLRNPTTPPHAENVVMESTYGDRLHKPMGPSVEEFYAAITSTFERGGNVVIPTFALERAQEVLYFLSQGVAQGRLKTSTQVYLDSPTAISATEIFRRHPECFDPETVKLLQEGHDPLAMPGLHFTRETADFVTINSVHGDAVILAGSGMCTAAACATTSSTISVATNRASSSSATPLPERSRASIVSDLKSCVCARSFRVLAVRTGPRRMQPMGAPRRHHSPGRPQGGHPSSFSRRAPIRLGMGGTTAMAAPFG